MKTKEKTSRDILRDYLRDMEFLTGLKQFREMSKEDASRLLDYLEETVKSYRWLNNNRLNFILKNGMQGGYGDFYGMNVKTLSSWISKYHEQNKHQIILEISYAEGEKETPEAEKRYWISKGIKRFKENWAKCKESSIVPDLDTWGPYWYGKMVDKGVLKENIYPMKELQDNAKRILMLEGRGRNVDPFQVDAKVRNIIWKEFISHCVQNGPDLSKIID